MKRIIAIILVIPILSLGQDTREVQKLINSKRYTSSESLLREKLEDRMANTVNWYWLGQALLQKRDSLNLINLKSSLPTGDDPWLLATRGIIALESGNLSDARNNFDRAITITRGKDEDVLAAVARGNIYSPNGDKLYALVQLKKAIKRDKKNPEFPFLQGEAQMRLRNGNDAFRSYNQALSVDANFTPALYALGILFTTQNNADVYLKYFNDAVAADPTFAPALYQLYFHYYKTDIRKAHDYFLEYLKNTDVDESDRYQLADILYLVGEYDQSIKEIHTLLNRENPQNRLNKLLAFTYKETAHTDSAIYYMNRYFSYGADTAYLLKDYEFMISIYDSLPGHTDSLITYYQKLLPLIKEDQKKVVYYKKLAEAYKSNKDYAQHALWYEKYYTSATNTTNLDLFNLGLAYYQSKRYNNADSIFVVYAEKYPEQIFGYYWQARSKSVIDSTMKLGLAIPVYKKVVEIAGSDTANQTYRRYLVEAYGYLAAYTVNEEKNYAGAIEYFERLLAIDPDNSDAIRYLEILRKATASE